MAKGKKYNWEEIERVYRTGQFKNREISRQHNVPESSLRRRAKKYGWVKDLTIKVKQKIEDNLLRDDDACATDKEIIENAAKRGAEVIKLHREDINRLRDLEKSLIIELSGSPTKLYLAQYKGQVIEKEVSLTAAERAQAANNLANVQHKRIQLERQAFNLNNDDGKAGGEETSKTVVVLPPKDPV